LGRNLRHLIDAVEDLEKRKVGFVSLQKGFDTTTNGGKFVFQIFGALAEFERNLIRERTKAGLEAARARGKLGGRKAKLNPTQTDALKMMYECKKYSISEICSSFEISNLPCIDIWKKSELESKHMKVQLTLKRVRNGAAFSVDSLETEIIDNNSFWKKNVSRLHPTTFLIQKG